MAVHVITRLLLDEIHPPVEFIIWLLSICFTSSFYVRLCYSSFPQKIVGFELASTIIVSLLTKRLNNLASHLRITHIRAWKQTQILIIAIPYTSVNSNRIVIPGINHIFHFVKCRTTWIAIIESFGLFE